jgi:hypothetical protein
MIGAISPLPQYALMAWCSVKARGQLYLYLVEVWCGDVNVIQLVVKVQSRVPLNTIINEPPGFIEGGETLRLRCYQF